MTHINNPHEIPHQPEPGAFLLPSESSRPIATEALEHLRAAAALGRQLARTAAELVPVIKSEEDRIKKDSESAALREKQDEDQIATGLASFATVLPKAHITKRQKDHAGVHNPVTFEIRAGSLEEALLLESQVWWIPCAPKHMDFDAEKKHLIKAWNDYLGVKSDEGSIVLKFGYEINQINLPYVVIGEKQDEVKEDQSDAKRDLLLYPLVRDAPMIVVEASSRKLDIAEEIGMEHLTKKIDSKYVLDMYRANLDNGYKAAYKVKKFTRDETVSGRSKVELTDEPRKESRKARYWDKVRSDIKWKGVPFSISESMHQLDRQDLEDFNVPFYSLKLAITLGLE